MTGTTMMIDPGLPTGLFTDVISSHGDHVNLVKFGWGTALVTRDLRRKVAALREAGVGFYFGGTLFEWYLAQDRVGEYLALVEETGATHIEVSNGTIPLAQSDKAAWVRRMTAHRPVLSEVGYKDAERSARLSPADWVGAIREDLDAGAELVITETRESGRSGMARPDGKLRDDVLRAVLARAEPGRLLFEAPTKDLQVELIRALGPEVNLGNIAPADLVGVATLRRGLRGDTLLQLTGTAATFPSPRAVSVA